MNDYTDAAKNIMLDALAPYMTRVALHSADPGAGADNEVGQRQPISWKPADWGYVDSAVEPVFIMQGGDSVSYISLWDDTGSTRYMVKQIPTSTFGADGVFTLSDVGYDLNDP